MKSRYKLRLRFSLNRFLGPFHYNFPRVLRGLRVMRAKTNSFSASQASVFGAFLRSTSRTCSRHSTSSGACKPMNRAKTWIVANRWFRVAMRIAASPRPCQTNETAVAVAACGWAFAVVAGYWLLGTTLTVTSPKSRASPNL